uniref:Uncharacterized protein n=1 Tax=Anopheles melas TaxID=34690 RepID=A0A182UA31_9DIPT
MKKTTVFTNVLKRLYQFYVMIMQEPHRWQRGTALHGIVRLGFSELMKVRLRRTPHVPGRPTRYLSPLLPEHQLKLSCTTCQQVICDEFPGGVSAAVDSLYGEGQQKLDMFVDEYKASLDEQADW